MLVFLATREAEIRRIAVHSQTRQIVHETLSRKNPSQKSAGGVALSSNPSAAKQQQQQKKPTLIIRPLFLDRILEFLILLL
jgi:hypothetical protein